jgi:hypothetical protein
MPGASRTTGRRRASWASADGPDLPALPDGLDWDGEDALRRLGFRVVWCDFPPDTAALLVADEPPTCYVGRWVRRASRAFQRYLVAHEWAHWQRRLLHAVGESPARVRWIETRADRTALRALVPDEEVVRAALAGVWQPDELAERWSIPEDRVRVRLELFVRERPELYAHLVGDTAAREGAAS